MDPKDSLWASWNVLLKPGTDRAARSAAILWAESKMKDDFNGKFNSSYALHLAVYYCPCDSLLYNIGAKVIKWKRPICYYTPATTTSKWERRRIICEQQ